MRSTLHKGGQVMMSASIARWELRSAAWLFLPLITVGLDVRHACGGATTLSGSDAINTGSGDRSCAEAESFCSSTLPFCRADAK